MRFRLSSLILVAGMAISSFAVANQGGIRLDDIRKQQSDIREGVLSKSGRYRDLPENTRNELLSRQTRLLATIDGKQVADDLNQTERTEVFNDLEWIEAAINRAQDERMVCEYIRTIGSNRKQRVCRTAAQVQQEHERSREELDRMQGQGRR